MIGLTINHEVCEVSLYCNGIRIESYEYRRNSVEELGIRETCVSSKPVQKFFVSTVLGNNRQKAKRFLWV